MKVTVEFESLKEFLNFGGIEAEGVSLGDIASSLNEVRKEISVGNRNLSEAIKANYRAGQDDVGGNLHKDIKDIDDVSENYSEHLYNYANALANVYRKHASEPKRKHLKSRIHDVTGDYEIRTGLSDDAYSTLIDSIRSLCVLNGIHDYADVDAEYAK